MSVLMQRVVRAAAVATAVLLLAAPALPAQAAAGPFTAAERARWARHAKRVTITRDTWGIAHVNGVSDADAVFGMMYAQAEDDFPRIESNYLDALGRRAEAEGERAIWQDLRMKLFVHPDSLRARFAASPGWLRALMTAWADGLNHYLATHPAVRPKVITRYEPWMPLAFSEGSIGGDIERMVSAEALAAFYGRRLGAAAPPPPPAYADATQREVFPEPTGSNGIAIRASHTKDGKALLLINPHTSFFFRAEQQVTSAQGLNAYGAATWGQFFIYQGFNDRLGWMHTSTGADAVDEYAETVSGAGDALAYAYGQGTRPVRTERIRVPYRDGAALKDRTFTVYRTHHGPIVREENGKWIAVRLMQEPVKALAQGWLRTKARNYAQFRRAAGYHANSSNNTIYADADGHIAYHHPHFVPKRSDRFDWRRPVDGSDPATEWGAPHALEDAPYVFDPASGFIQNTNNHPYSVSGPEHSPKRERFPAYMDWVGENPRGLHALQLLQGRRDWTLDALVSAAYDPYLPAFAALLPPLVRAYDALPAGDTLRAALAEPVAALRGWDFRWSAASVPTTVAVTWAEAFFRAMGSESGRGRRNVYDYAVQRSGDRRALEFLADAVATLAREQGTWRTPWGAVNRFQRLTADIRHPFRDDGPSIPVPFTSAEWGSLASFGAVRPEGSTKRYGTSGNSFVAVVEFGKDRVRARAVSAGGQSGDPASPHFRDQAQRYADGNLREVWFYPDELAAHVERRYRPGE